MGVRREAVGVLARFGKESDVSDVLAGAGETYGSVKEEALAAAMRLSPGPSGAMAILLTHDDPVYVRTALQHADATTTRAAMEQIRGLLGREKEGVRELGVANLVKTLDVDELDSPLVVYTRGGYYYYNVVGWLDRVLYAPGPVKRKFQMELVEKLRPK